MGERRGGQWIVFFFQAEDGIRDVAVTGVQTCALPIFAEPRRGREVIPSAIPLRRLFQLGQIKPPAPALKCRESAAANLRPWEWCCRWRPRPARRRTSSPPRCSQDRQMRACEANAPLLRTRRRSLAVAAPPARESPSLRQPRARL